MNIDRPMASLFFEIKRNMPFEEREEMKIAAPDVGDRLVAVYRGSKNKALKELIKNFMNMAGPDWSQQLDKPKRSKLLFYRSASK